MVSVTETLIRVLGVLQMFGGALQRLGFVFRAGSCVGINGGDFEFFAGLTRRDSIRLLRPILITDPIQFKQNRRARVPTSSMHSANHAELSGIDVLSGRI